MTETPIKLRKRVRWFPLVAMTALILFTIGNAAASILGVPKHVPGPTREELQRAEQLATTAARRDRIAALQAEGDRCRPLIARELARALVFDGRSALPYADDYARRCGDDPIVRQWADVGTRVRLVRVD